MWLPPAQLLVSGDHSVAVSVDEPVMAALNIYVDLSECAWRCVLHGTAWGRHGGAMGAHGGALGCMRLHGPHGGAPGFIKPLA